MTGWRVLSAWRIAYEGFDPAAQGLREALCTLGNGFFATRGANPECAADGTHYPGTYVAGLYDRLVSPVAGRMVENESLVNVPNWLPLSFRAAGAPWPGGEQQALLSEYLELDMYEGLLLRRASFQDAQGRIIRVEQRRVVSLRSPHLAGLETTLVAENWSGQLEILTAIDGTVRNSGVARYRGLPDVHLRPVATSHEDEDRIGLVVETVQSGIRVAVAARTRLWVNAEPGTAGELSEVAGYIGRLFSVAVRPGDTVRVEKIAALFTSRDPAVSEPALASRQAVESAPSFEDLLDGHRLAWCQVWRRHHHDVQADEEVASSLNLSIFHLAQTLSNNAVGLDVGVPARGLHGEAYRGHVFWDELFVLPVLSLHFPQLSRSLLLYRYRRLERARQTAAASGYQGAMFPWQSGSDGREESQTMHLNPASGRWVADSSRLQHHVGAAIALNVWQYHQVTRDMEFLRFYGAELMLEIARFWSSIATWDDGIGRYEIKGVMGPDEYHDGYPDRPHPGLDNNAYTNLMAVWCLLRALEVLEIMPETATREVTERVGLTADETERWEDISRHMRICFHDGLISQFEGFEKLEELDLDAYRSAYGDIRRLDRILEAEGDTTNRYQVSKQADTVMLFYLFSEEEVLGLLERLGYHCDATTVSRTIDYYAPRTVNGSSLGRTVDAWISSRRGHPGAWDAFWATAREDLSDVQRGTTAEGIHLGAMAGYIDLFQRCFTGLRIRGDTVVLEPAVPARLGSFSFQAAFWGQTLQLSISPDLIGVDADPANRLPVAVEIRGRPFRLRPGSHAELALASVT